jgi:hypothetical protein
MRIRLWVVIIWLVFVINIGEYIQNVYLRFVGSVLGGRDHAMLAINM